MSRPAGTTELAELHDLIGGLRRCVSSLKARYGDSPAMRRIVIDADRILSDVELLDTDVSELDLARATVQQSGGCRGPQPVLTTQAPRQREGSLCVPFDQTARSKRNTR